jgi:hypothetical protein
VARFDLACRKAKELGYPHELWTTRLLAQHARTHGPRAGHACLAHLAQGTVCKILDQEEIKPHKVRYYLEQRDPDFAERMAEVLCVYRTVKTLKKVATATPRVIEHIARIRVQLPTSRADAAHCSEPSRSASCRPAHVPRPKEPPTQADQSQTRCTASGLTLIQPDGSPARARQSEV